MSRKISDDQQMMVLLGKKNADEKVASFLLNLSNRFKKRGYSASSLVFYLCRAGKLVTTLDWPLKLLVVSSPVFKKLVNTC